MDITELKTTQSNDKIFNFTKLDGTKQRKSCSTL
jgi:hypothetical protein